MRIAASLALLFLTPALPALAQPARPAPPATASAPVPLPTGVSITPSGKQTGVGSFPTYMVQSPDGRFIVVTTAGARQHLTVLDARTGHIVSQRDFNAPRQPSGGGRQALYVGLAFGASNGIGSDRLYVSRGTEAAVSEIGLSGDGTLGPDQKTLRVSESKGPLCLAGVIVSGDGRTVYAADNQASPATDFKGALYSFDVAAGEQKARLALPGFPLAVANCTRGPAANRKLYVTSERDGIVCDVDPDTMTVRRTVATGSQPIALLLDKPQRRLFVANSGSDTVSIVSTGTDKVIATILLRPAGARGLPGATPTGLALDEAGNRLFVTLADMNAVAVVDVKAARPRLLGYIPTGWYPTSVIVAPGGKHLFVANAKGAKARVPNRDPQGPKGAWGKYVMGILDGSVERMPMPQDRQMPALTARVLSNNRVAAITSMRNAMAGLPIRHVIYIIKENRTYDQVFGDMKRGNGDPSLTLFGQKVTPNQHALAERFVLFDNFYCCAEVSADGWNWSASGMANQHTQRNTATNYGGRGRTGDFWGMNNDAPVDLLDFPDVARSPGGYIWDNCLKHGVTFRNYGFFVEKDVKMPDGKVTAGVVPLRKALRGHTDLDFPSWDLSFADSDAWVHADLPQTVQRKAFGRHKATSRFAEWKREFDGYVKNGNLPRLTILALPRNHTEGTTAGAAAPAAMVADNDYAVGQVVEAVSKSRYWKSTAIFIIEDDPQDGFDHVDCHRSVCLVISPYVRRGMVDSRFYNTDSVLHTMQRILGLPPMTRYDASAPLFEVWTKTPYNIEPYKPVLPDRSILGQVNARTAYRAADSARLRFDKPDGVPDQVLNDILWHAVKGVSTPKPAIRHNLMLGEHAEED